MKRPAFDELPLNKDDPPYSAWGLYGPEDELGTLNLLTPEIITEASKEIRTGVRVGLNLPMNFLDLPSHKRLNITHKLVWKQPRAVFDDEITMNTQISTQWDGLRHYGYQKLNKFYNGATAEEINASPSRLGLQAWCKEGIAGRGVLLDYLGWRKSEHKKFDLMSDHEITAEDLKKCAKFQNITLKEGDILLIRSGFTAGYSALTDEEKQAWGVASPTRWVGLETSIETLRFFWESGVSAVAGDAPGFERLPLAREPHLHEVMLGGWGMPIGEMFDLEALTEECIKQGRYTFFLTSMPLNVTGGVGSPPGALAIF